MKLSTRRRHGRQNASRRGAAALAATASISIAGSLVTGASSAVAARAAKAAASGKVTAIFAGSLVDIMEKALGPEFTRSTGYQFEGFGGGSGEDAAAIKGR